jgi:hypothetical protein
MRAKMGLQVFDPAKMGLQVLHPAKGWYNGQVRPRVLPHGNDNHHECSNSAFFQRKNRKSVLAVCAIRLNGQTYKVIRTVRITRTEPSPYHSSLLIIYIKATMLVFDL